jgi:hypothetical protein
LRDAICCVCSPISTFQTNDVVTGKHNSKDWDVVVTGGMHDRGVTVV